MFDRFIRLQQARRALQEQRFEDALQLAKDPVIAADRRAERVRAQALAALLERGRKRLHDGDLRGARGLAERLGGQPGEEPVRAFVAEFEAAEQAARERGEAARQACAAAERLLGEGDLEGAEAALTGVAGAASAAPERLRQQIVDRRQQAAAELAAVADLLRQRQIDAARQAFARAAALDRRGAAVAAVAAPLRAAVVDQGCAAITARLAADDLAGALGQWRMLRGDAGAAGARLDGAERLIGKALVGALAAAGDLGQAGALAAVAAGAGFAPAGALGDLLAALPRAGGTVPVATAGALAQAARQLGLGGLAGAAQALAERQAAHAVTIDAARARAAAGDLDAARAQLAEVLAEDPMHESARRELDLVEQGISDLGARLAAARTAARTGRLGEACAAALPLGPHGQVGAEARLLLADVRARMALVDRGLAEVLAALHGRAAGSAQGVRHSLSRLRELGKVQTDHGELTRVTAAVAAEVAGLEACERIGAALAAGRIAEAADEIEQVLATRGALLQPERLDARLGDCGDRLAVLAEQALVRGDGRSLAACRAGLARLTVVDAAFGAAGERFTAAVAGRTAEAAALLVLAEAALAQRDLAEAERLGEDAFRAWAEAPGVSAMVERLRALRRQTEAVDQAAALTRDRDFRGAAERLAELPPTPPLLRTRIFDMKQELRRAQGLEGAFLLRVDEGGEHLVLRGESVSIGNMRQRTADLPILANIAGRHATIRRSMSFHGGMEDTVVADDGEVRVGGQVVGQHRLQPGDRVQFGPALAALYVCPTQRSLTAGLVLQGGFQVAGTERILLMKDRGRDGRVLLGPSRDVHVRVAGASGEVELFAAGNGQIRVACAAGGTIDGIAFRGEHPVDAGQLVTAAGITFTLLPWRPA